MPLIKSGSRKAVGKNISELQSAGRPHDQAVAIALRNARDYGAKFAAGGAPKKPHSGFLHSPVPGRTDKLPISVKGGAYVLPADHVSALGQNNSLAGAEIVNKTFRLGPYGSTPTKLRGTKVSVPHLDLRRSKFAEGGAAEDVPIVAAGGEIVIPPEAIIERFGDLEKGHRALDRWVLDTRRKHIATLKSLKPPKKN